MATLLVILVGLLVVGAVRQQSWRPTATTQTPSEQALTPGAQQPPSGPTPGQSLEESTQSQLLPTPSGPQRRVGTVSLTPATGDVPNTGRGQYLWFPDDHPAGVGGLSATDSYVRYSWRQVEPSAGQYTFTAIEQELAKAKARRGQFGFRIMAVCSGCGQSMLPDDVDALPTTWTTQADGATIRVPDWNDPALLSRWESLMAALGQRFNGDPRLGFIDVGGYGNWGEGHNWPYESTYPGPGGQQEASIASATRIIRAVTAAFPRSFVVLNPFQMRAAGQYSPTATYSVLKQAMLDSPRTGLRNDCVGGGSVQQSAVDLFAQVKQRSEQEGLPWRQRPMERWRIAPFITEWCNNIAPGTTDGTFTQGAQQVRDWHISLVSNGNFQQTVGAYPAAAQTALRSATTLAGFRLGVSSLSLDQGSTTADLTVRARWVNTGVAPPYHPWRVEYQLRNSSGAVVARGGSGFEVRTLLGGGSSRDDVVVLGQGRHLSGALSVEVRLLDPSATLPPLRLSTGTRTSDGAYRLGQFSVPRA